MRAVWHRKPRIKNNKQLGRPKYNQHNDRGDDHILPHRGSVETILASSLLMRLYSRYLIAPGNGRNICTIREKLIDRPVLARCGSIAIRARRIVTRTVTHFEA